MDSQYQLCSFHGVRPKVPGWGMRLCDRCREVTQARIEALREPWGAFWQRDLEYREKRNRYATALQDLMRQQDVRIYMDRALNG